MSIYSWEYSYSVNPSFSQHNGRRGDSVSWSSLCVLVDEWDIYNFEESEMCSVPHLGVVDQNLEQGSSTIMNIDQPNHSQLNNAQP